MSVALALYPTEARKFCTGTLPTIFSRLLRMQLGGLPDNLRTSWNLESRASFAVPAAESPSTRKSSRSDALQLLAIAKMLGNITPRFDSLTLEMPSIIFLNCSLAFLAAPARPMTLRAIVLLTLNAALNTVNT